MMRKTAATGVVPPRSPVEEELYDVYVTIRNNVGGVWLKLNSQGHIAPKRAAMDNLAAGNCYNSSRLQGNWTDYLNNIAIDNVAIEVKEWPESARRVIENSGSPKQDAKP